MLPCGNRLRHVASRGMAVPSTSLHRPDRAPDTPLRLGVVGNGNRGIIAKTAADLDPSAQVVAACDPLPRARDRAAERFGPGVAATATVDELIGVGVDAAFVTSPDHLHAEHACALLEAGVAVFVDKPLAISVEEADRILAAARRAG